MAQLTLLIMTKIRNFDAFSLVIFGVSAVGACDEQEVGQAC